MAILSPYLNFRERSRSVMRFYHSVFGGELVLTTFSQLGAAQDPSENDLVMHSQLTTPSGFTIMAADVPKRLYWVAGENNFAIALSGQHSESAELTGYFEKLTRYGMVDQPLSDAAWGGAFGMGSDQFDVHWLVTIAGGQS